MRKWAPWCLLLLLAGLGWGLAALLEARFGGGDIYPPGSSLRSDRQGARVLHDSLARLRPVRRNFGRLEPQDLRHVTILMLYANATQLGDGAWRDLTRRGARVVIALAPVLLRRTERVLSSLDLTLTYSEPTAEMQDTPAWRSGRETTLRLNPQSAAWRSLLAGTILERPVDRGSLVVAANATLLSNAALAQSPSSALLARIIGPVDQIVFEETHLGVRDAPGVMVLVRRYGLLGLLFALLALAGLFVWQAAYPLVPLAPSVTEQLEISSDRTAESGLAQLLRRGIPPAELIAVCAREWERLATPTPTQRQAVRQALSESAHPVTAFARATQALERKR